MTTHTHTRTVYAPSNKAEKPHCFLLRWNNSKNKEMAQGKNAWHEAYCCQFPNGWIATDFGPAYKTMHELTDMLEEAGEHSIEWLESEASND